MSWAEDLKTYESQKQSLAPAFASAEPVKRITKGGGATELRQHRSYNIVSNNAPSASEESTFRATRDAQQARQREHAVAKQALSTLHNYNIITMKMNGSESEENAKGNQELKGKLVSKDGNTFLGTARYALEPDAWKSPPPTPRTVLKAQLKHDRAEAMEREYNIVSQEYRVDHDAKAALDRTAERQRVNAAAMKTTSYNPLTCKFRHLDEEAKAQSEERERRTQFRIPKFVAESDGGAYNVLNNTIINESQAALYDAKAVRGLAQRSDRRREFETMRDALEEERAFHAERGSVNRVQQVRRDAEALSHGHDILSNRPFATNVGQYACAADSTKPSAPLSNFRPMSTIDTIRYAQEKKMLNGSTANGAGAKLRASSMHQQPSPSTFNFFNNTGNTLRSPKKEGAPMPHTSYDRIFDREALAPTHVDSRRFWDTHSLPKVGDGVVSSGWDSTPDGFSTRSAVQSTRLAGGAANNLDKNEMGKCGVKKVPAPSSGGGGSQKTGANNSAKAQLKPLVSVNLTKNDGADKLRSFF